MYTAAIRTIRTLLPDKGSVTRTQIETQVDFILRNERFSDLDRDQLIREVESLYRVRVDEFRVIEAAERRSPWVKDVKSTVEWKFWDRYKNYLQIRKNFAPETIGFLDRLTDKTLDGLYNPKLEIGFDKKGLVVGQVQSGKTSNYIGLICKAVDAGYNMVIVLTGMHNNLRAQTQLRIDEGFLGFDTKHKRREYRIGVGAGGEIYPAHPLTTNDDKGDFKIKGAHPFHSTEPIIAVVKKNATVLSNLHSWLLRKGTDDGSGKRKINEKSLLLIDDEADNASINISQDPNERSAINRHITDIIGLFVKSGYVGYTATPFANIFSNIDENDIFPRDFIINLPAPSNYIGPEKVFGFKALDDGESSPNVLPMVNRIDDYGSFVPNKHKKGDPKPTVIPESLKRAIRCFIITCAIRRLRGQGKEHNSMLVHVTRYQDWQECICEMVQEVTSRYQRGIDQNLEAVLQEFKETFEEDVRDEKRHFKSYTTVSNEILNSELADIDPMIQMHEWEDVLTHLNHAASRIEVRAINGGSKDVLDYVDHEGGLSVIAIGGDKLSRGLTLEGLSVSYYLRASTMYDTLMQMGRWFGYRPGYVDLCRLYTSRELNEWFCHITHATEELREEFDYMADVAGSTPEKYALKVRTHPGVLQITASNRMRNIAEIEVTWSGRLVESYEMKRSKDTIDNNFKATNSFIGSLDADFETRHNHYLWRNIPVEKVTGYLRNIQALENLKAYDPKNLIRFIDMQTSQGELVEWTVALMTKERAEHSSAVTFGDGDKIIGSWLRTQDENNSNEEIYYLRKSHLISPKDEFLDLTDTEYERAMRLTEESWRKRNLEGEPQYPIGHIVRNEIRQPQKALLLLYLLDPKGAELPSSSNPILAYAISFPKSNSDSYVSFAVHTQLLDRFDFDYEPEK